jgi:long-chain acyl-CoA synthetase
MQETAALRARFTSAPWPRAPLAEAAQPVEPGERSLRRTTGWCCALQNSLACARRGGAHRRRAHSARRGAFFRTLGVPLIEVYGLTESTGMVTGHDFDRVSGGHRRHSHAGVQAHCPGQRRDDMGGEFQIKGDMVFAGYYKTPRPRRKASRTAGCTRATWCACGRPDQDR